MENYESLAKRYLGRELRKIDGSTLLAIQRTEKRIGCALPQSIRRYYELCGGNRKLNKSYNLVRTLNEIAIEDGYLMIMDENQSVVSWGIRLADVPEIDPIIWQRNNTPPIAWYSEEKTWPELLASMYAWYIEAGIWKRAEQLLHATAQKSAAREQ